MRYYLANDIYFDWATFVKVILMPQGEKRKLFVKCQEWARKDVEKAFDVLKSQFTIICGPSRNWQMGTMKNIILICIILNNMIVEDEWDTYNDNVNIDYNYIFEEISNIDVSHGAHSNFVAYLQTRRYMHTRGVHQQLPANLVDHIWEYFNQNNDEI